jgi:P pilus assembly chaperone PapD
MYMTHIWENPTFTPPGNFRTQALDTLGNGEETTPGLAQHVVAGGDFENTPENEVRAFIVTPLELDVFNQSTDIIRYPNELTKLKHY